MFPFIMQYDVKLRCIYDVSISDIICLTSWAMLMIIAVTAIVIAKAKGRTLS